MPKFLSSNDIIAVWAALHMVDDLVKDAGMNF